DERIDSIFALLFKKSAGNTNDNREHRNQRQQGGISQRRSAHRAAIAHKATPDQYPEMHHPPPFRSVKSILVQQRLSAGAHLLEFGDSLGHCDRSNANRAKVQVNCRADCTDRPMSGVRPSSGAATVRSTGRSELIELLEPAAPEDGRTPLIGNARYIMATKRV